MFNRTPLPVQTADQLSAHLKSLRKAQSLTQAALGKRIGVKQVRIADIERDPGSISVEQLIAILHALDARLFVGTATPAAGSGPLTAQEPTPSW
ncbi:MAG TPA: helix-turn-helix domain-containing protein [Ramlibacter sp.]|nr:helix-turn-helix domain-containing protein [Ramlibacter sp.]